MMCKFRLQSAVKQQVDFRVIAKNTLLPISNKY